MPGARRQAMVAIAGFLVTTVSGAVWGSFSIFLVAIERDTGWSKTAISLAFTVFTLAGTFAVPVIGLLIDRFGTRLVIAGLSLLLALGLATSALSRAPLEFYLAFGVVAGVGVQAAGTFALFMIAANWFRRQATAMAVMDSGSGLGTLVALPLLQAIIDAHSWRMAYLALAVLALALILPLSHFLALSPPGATPVRARSSATFLGGVRAILGDATLRLMVVIFLLAPLCYHAINAHQVAFMQQGGLAPDLTVALVSAGGLTFLLGRLALGALIDARGIRFAEIIIAACAFAAMAILFAVFYTPAQRIAYAFPLVYGIGFSTTGIIFAATVRVLVDSGSFAIVYGALRLVYGFGVAFGPPFVAAITDATQRYDIAFAAVAVLLVANHATYLLILARRGVR